MNEAIEKLNELQGKVWASDLYIRQEAGRCMVSGVDWTQAWITGVVHVCTRQINLRQYF